MCVSSKVSALYIAPVAAAGFGFPIAFPFLYYFFEIKRVILERRKAQHKTINRKLNTIKATEGENAKIANKTELGISYLKVSPVKKNKLNKLTTASASNAGDFQNLTK